MHIDSPSHVFRCLCHYCGKGFSFQYELDKHLLRHHRSKATAAKANSVRHCGQEFVDMATITQHLKAMVRPRPTSPPAPTLGRKVACQECGRTFARKADLQQHQDHTKKHRSTDHKNGVTCKECRRTFACTADLQNHQKATGHEPLKDLIYAASHGYRDAPALTCVACRECRKAFACEADLQQHQHSLKHRGVSDLIPVACEVCQKALIRKGDLQSHQEAFQHNPLSDLSRSVGESPLSMARSSSWSTLTGDIDARCSTFPNSRSVSETSDATGPDEDGTVTPCTIRTPSSGSSVLSVD